MFGTVIDHPAIVGLDIASSPPEGYSELCTSPNVLLRNGEERLDLCVERARQRPKRFLRTFTVTLVDPDPTVPRGMSCSPQSVDQCSLPDLVKTHRHYELFRAVRDAIALAAASL
jgi:hypothetical protein